MGFGVWGLGFGVWGLGFGVHDLMHTLPHLCSDTVAVLYVINQLLAAPQTCVVDVAAELDPSVEGLLGV